MVFLRRLLPRLRFFNYRIISSTYSSLQPPLSLLPHRHVDAEVADFSLHRQGPLFPFSVFLRSFAKAKKSKGDEDSTVVYEDMYPIVKENTETQMEAGLDSLSREISKLRTGRISAGMLDHVTVVDNNGIRSPLTHVAAVTVVDNENLRVTPFDSSILKCIERGVRSSPLKLNPVVEGDIVSVPVPKPTKEYIETMLKVVGKAAETAKMSIRRARQIAMDAIKKSTGNISKDDIKRREKQIEELTKKFVKTVDDTCKAKKEMLSG